MIRWCNVRKETGDERREKNTGKRKERVELRRAKYQFVEIVW